MASQYNLSNVSPNTTIAGRTPGGGYGQDYYQWNFAFSVILATVESISAFLAVVGNSMVLTVVIRHRGMRTRTNLFLVNLAVADLLVGAAVMPFAITTLVEGRWVFGDTDGDFCTINGWLNCFCLVASIHTLMYISVHKHYSITQPLGSHFKLRQILGMMAAAWAWAAVSSTITVTGLSSVRYKEGTSQCGPEYPHGLKSYIFHGIIQFTNILIPVIILTYCYTRMFREIRAHTKRLQLNSTLEQDTILAQQKKVTITLFIVLACFVICALPFHLYATYTTIRKDKTFSPYLNPLAYCSLYLNSALNPIIYAFRSPSFREGYKEILCQTPTYVISDDLATEDLQSPLRRRLSFLFSSTRRASVTSSIKDNRSSCASLNSVGSQVGSPGVLISNPLGKGPGAKRQKGMAGLIRASRRSTKQSSIIRQNGDIIIVKGGKIVSIRRESGLRAPDSSGPFLQTPLQRNGTGGRREVNGHVGGEGSGLAQGTPADPGKLTVLPDNRVSSASSEGSDNVFEDGASNALACADLVAESSLEMISEERRLLSQCSETDHVETDVDDDKHPSCEHVTEACARDAADRESAEDDKNLTTDVGIIISIDEDNSVLNVMPLTPRTRDRITRSDLFLGAESRAEQDAPKDMKTSRSTQGLCKRSLQRLPSVEHLDPPFRIKRASSDYNVHQGTDSDHFLKPTPVSRRWSFGKRPERTPVPV
ncbi:uncharacterized protein LOC143296584 [Babylonia areolata]|uniref:uncharacterized protein LOC143296584 n=1 Tax=Babylonia areolata TaxID=304850 RepID=UPI003FCF2290